jgi:hypothetical protein
MQASWQIVKAVPVRVPQVRFSMVAPVSATGAGVATAATAMERRARVLKNCMLKVGGSLIGRKAGRKLKY